MSHPDPGAVLEHARRLAADGQTYALVSVLRVQPPASARPGDKAVVTADGIAAGWIGGGCAQPAVVKTVRQALADGQARLIRIAPDEAGTVRELGDVLEFGMACHSGGTLELFVDPVLPRARLLVIGDSPLAVALAALAPRVGLATTVVAHGSDAARFPDAERVLADDAPAAVAAALGPGAFVVVATQGRRDLQGLRAALGVGARQVFFVASAKKAQVLKAALVEAGHDRAAVEAIVAPAGTPIGAQTPEEIALSVLGAVVAARRAAPATVPATVPAAAAESAPAPAPDRPARVAAPAVAASGSCCGGGAAPAAELPGPAPAVALTALPAAGGSCCGS